MGAEEWAKAMNYKGTYVELLGSPATTMHRCDLTATRV